MLKMIKGRATLYFNFIWPSINVNVTIEVLHCSQLHIVRFFNILYIFEKFLKFLRLQYWRYLKTEIFENFNLLKILNFEKKISLKNSEILKIAILKIFKNLNFWKFQPFKDFKFWEKNFFEKFRLFKFFYDFEVFNIQSTWKSNVAKMLKFIILKMLRL